ncbi:hypothetical protein ABE321_15895 [Bacillus paralicheniformis]|uniref:hypothetical protein n=1 Tax=Bacillus paralicheniformis TaxID=1648923 RepID=UPI0011AB6676|nr:hypothetical protein [Bacillus paralicheniformis]MEC1824076.1 hypothetical protein [Bacillus paralicheniformis]TWK23028.1 hypothetical protein CHCC20372_3435 [Bacillus paralicheniformis]
MAVKLHRHIWWDKHGIDEFSSTLGKERVITTNGKLEIEILLTGDSNRSRVVRRIMDAVEEIIEKENAKDAE